MNAALHQNQSELGVLVLQNHPRHQTSHFKFGRVNIYWNILKYGAWSTFFHLQMAILRASSQSIDLLTFESFLNPRFLLRGYGCSLCCCWEALKLHVNGNFTRPRVGARPCYDNSTRKPLAPLMAQRYIRRCRVGFHGHLLFRHCFRRTLTNIICPSIQFKRFSLHT